MYFPFAFPSGLVNLGNSPPRCMIVQRVHSGTTPGIYSVLFSKFSLVLVPVLHCFSYYSFIMIIISRNICFLDFFLFSRLLCLFLFLCISKNIKQNLSIHFKCHSVIDFPDHYLSVSDVDLLLLSFSVL